MSDMIALVFQESKAQDRCNHVKSDERGPYCSIGHDQGTEPSQGRRAVCSLESLQDYCLAGKARYTGCPFYNGKASPDDIVEITVKQQNSKFFNS